MNMRHMKSGLLVGLMAMAVAGGAFAMEVVESWGHGTTLWEARDDARASGRQACLSKGYSFAVFELVDTAESGGGYVAYGLSTCYP